MPGTRNQRGGCGWGYSKSLLSGQPAGPQGSGFNERYAQHTRPRRALYKLFVKCGRSFTVLALSGMQCICKVKACFIALQRFLRDDRLRCLNVVQHQKIAHGCAYQVCVQFVSRTQNPSHSISTDGAMVQTLGATSFSAARACFASSPMISLTTILVSSAALNLTIWLVICAASCWPPAKPLHPYQPGSRPGQHRPGVGE